MVTGVVDLHTCLQGEGKYAGIPHILIRMSGCPMRCAFGDSLCDSPFTSWLPEKGSFNEDQIYEVYACNSQIKYTMITGGEPFFNPCLLEQLISIAKKFNHFITIETAGIQFHETSADFISLSPKLSNSIPREKMYSVEGRQINITSSLVSRHDKLRRNYDQMRELIHFHKDYQLKPVIFNIEEDMREVRDLVDIIGADISKLYLMPAGSTNEQLDRIRVPLMEYCQREGYNYTDRLHIVAYGNKRGV